MSYFVSILTQYKALFINKHFEYFEDMIRMEAFEVFYTTSKFEVNGGVNSLIQPWKEAGEIFSRHVMR